jgi:uncharacterized protein (DUF885 family)
MGGKMNANEMFERLTQEMMDKFLERNPDFATFLGLHDPYDYLLPNGSTENLLQTLHLIEEWTRRLNETIDPKELSEEHRVEWEVIQTANEQGKFAFYEQKKHELDPNAFEELGGLLFLMLTRDYAPLENRLDAIAARTEKLPKYLNEFRSRFTDSKPVKLWTQIATEVAQNMAGLFQFILYAAKDKVSDKVYERLNKAVLNIQPALETHLEWLQSLLHKTTEQWALGTEKFEKLLQLRGLGMSSDEIYDLGVKHLAELKAQRTWLAQQIAPAKSVEEVLKMIESKSPKTFEEALEFTAKSMEEARRFVQEKNLATVFPEDVLLVKETPSYLAPMIPFAALMMPARFDKPQIGIYIVTRPKDVSNLGKHLNYASVRNTAVHEAFPGHFLQGAISNRGSIVHMLANGTETTEGWAHYCEQMMTEKGFATDPEARLMQVNDMIWRAVRIIVDIKLARGEMSFEEAVTMLVRETGMSREGAEAEVKRYTQTPGYALSYLLGKHLLLELKEELKRNMGEKFDERLFHDTITANGYLPICLLRKVFDQKTREFKKS